MMAINVWANKSNLSNMKCRCEILSNNFDSKHVFGIKDVSDVHYPLYNIYSGTLFANITFPHAT